MENFNQPDFNEEDVIVLIEAMETMIKASAHGDNVASMLHSLAKSEGASSEDADLFSHLEDQIKKQSQKLVNRVEDWKILQGKLIVMKRRLKEKEVLRAATAIITPPPADNQS
jgi:hypothetical protein